MEGEHRFRASRNDDSSSGAKGLGGVGNGFDVAELLEAASGIVRFFYVTGLGKVNPLFRSVRTLGNRMDAFGLLELRNRELTAHRIGQRLPPPLCAPNESDAGPCSQESRPVNRHQRA